MHSNWIILPVALLVIMTTGYIWTYFSDKKEWNKGICPHCKKGNWHSFDTDSSGATGIKCDNCGKYSWINFNHLMNTFIKYDIKHIRLEKLKKIL
jgi:hypothetical protein